MQSNEQLRTIFLPQRLLLNLTFHFGSSNCSPTLKDTCFCAFLHFERFSPGYFCFCAFVKDSCQAGYRPSHAGVMPDTGQVRHKILFSYLCCSFVSRLLVCLSSLPLRLPSTDLGMSSPGSSNPSSAPACGRRMTQCGIKGLPGKGKERLIIISAQM